MSFFLSTILSVQRWWNNCQLLTATVDGYEWRYLDTDSLQLGPGATPGRTLVLLHGFGASKETFVRLAGLFSGAYRVVVPDLLGFGESARPSQISFHPAAQASRVVALLDALNVRGPVHVAGNSMGGLITAYMALNHAERLASVSLICAAGVRSPNPSALDRLHANGETPLLVRSIEDFDRILGMIFYKPPPIPAFAKTIFCERMKKDADFNTQIFNELTEMIGSQELEKRLGEIQTPTLVLWGREDQLLDVSAAQVFGDAIKDSKVVVLDELGHVPHEESPERAYKVLNEFLNSL